jgi:hypothetical protein
MSVSPSGKEIPLEHRPDGTFAVPAPPEVGLYRVKVRRGAEVRGLDDPALAFPVVFSLLESDTRRIESRDLYARLGSGPKRQTEAPAVAARSQPIPLWTGLLGLGALTFFLEGALLVP